MSNYTKPIQVSRSCEQANAAELYNDNEYLQICCDICKEMKSPRAGRAIVQCSICNKYVCGKHHVKCHRCHYYVCTTCTWKHFSPVTAMQCKEDVAEEKNEVVELAAEQRKAREAEEQKGKENKIVLTSMPMVHRLTDEEINELIMDEFEEKEEKDLFETFEKETEAFKKLEEEREREREEEINSIFEADYLHVRDLEIEYGPLCTEPAKPDKRDHPQPEQQDADRSLKRQRMTLT